MYKYIYKKGFYPGTKIHFRSSTLHLSLLSCHIFFQQIPLVQILCYTLIDRCFHTRFRKRYPPAFRLRVPIERNIEKLRAKRIATKYEPWWVINRSWAWPRGEGVGGWVEERALPHPPRLRFPMDLQKSLLNSSETYGLQSIQPFLFSNVRHLGSSIWDVNFFSEISEKFQNVFHTNNNEKYV